MSEDDITSWVYRRQVDGVLERLVIMRFVARPAETLIHLERSRGAHPRVLLQSRLIPPPSDQTWEVWLKQQDSELRNSGWGCPIKLDGIH